MRKPVVRVRKNNVCLYIDNSRTTLIRKSVILQIDVDNIFVCTEKMWLFISMSFFMLVFLLTPTRNPGRL